MYTLFIHAGPDNAVKDAKKNAGPHAVLVRKRILPEGNKQKHRREHQLRKKGTEPAHGGKPHSPNQERKPDLLQDKQKLSDISNPKRAVLENRKPGKPSEGRTVENRKHKDGLGIRLFCKGRGNGKKRHRPADSG